MRDDRVEIGDDDYALDSTVRAWIRLYLLLFHGVRWGFLYIVRVLSSSCFGWANGATFFTSSGHGETRDLCSFNHQTALPVPSNGRQKYNRMK